MSRFLMIDIGAGTMDILIYDTGTGEHFKAVGPSPVRQVARRIERTEGHLVVSGVEMGGGPVSDILRRRAATHDVVMTPSAAATLHHDLQTVRGWGIAVADEAQIERLSADSRYTAVRLGDVQPGRIAQIVEGLDLPMAFDGVALCAQDHGMAPPGVSHLEYRHNLFQQMLNPSPYPHKLLFRDDEIPEAFNRLRGMALDARKLNGGEIFVMDSGMAAMVGAVQDPRGRRDDAPVMLLDIATSHTVAATMEGDRVAGFVEYHTRDITLARLETLLRELADGHVRHDRILAEGGHGAYLRKAVGFERLAAIIATGPKRVLLEGSRLPISWGAPWGDNMMTGTVGLLEAVRRRKGMAPIDCT